MPTVAKSAMSLPIEKEQATPREFDILDVLLILAARKGMIFLASVAGFVLGLGWCFWLPRRLPPKQ